MHERSISWGELARIFFYTGLRSFGGWSTTALLLEQELVTRRKLLDKKHFISGSNPKQIQ